MNGIGKVAVVNRPGFGHVTDAIGMKRFKYHGKCAASLCGSRPHMRVVSPLVGT